jgi:hypothetical protein
MNTTGMYNYTMILLHGLFASLLAQRAGGQNNGPSSKGAMASRLFFGADESSEEDQEVVGNAAEGGSHIQSSAFHGQAPITPPAKLPQDSCISAQKTLPGKCRNGGSVAGSQTTLTKYWGQALAQTTTTTKKTEKRAPRGTALTYLGHRPPKDPTKLAEHLRKYDEYHTAKGEKPKDEHAKRKRSETQLEFNDYMRMEIRSRPGTPQQRMAAAASSWKSRTARLTAAAADEILSKRDGVEVL